VRVRRIWSLFVEEQSSKESCPSASDAAKEICARLKFQQMPIALIV
jgi:hypothetical protein